MRSDELADAVKTVCKYISVPREFTELCVERVLGPGNDQYSLGDQQAFELLPIDRLTLMFDEEVADVLVYVVMLCVRLYELGNYHAVGRLKAFAETLTGAYSDLREIEEHG